MSYYYATVKSDHILVVKDDIEEIKITSFVDLKTLENKITGEDVFMCSSSLDFPFENTYLPRVVRLCELIRGNDFSDDAWMVGTEMHIGNNTFHLTSIIYANSYESALEIFENLKPDYGDDDPETCGYDLKVKSLLGRVAESITETIGCISEY